ncbi:MAG: DUF3987 domain-containing protein [Planctomycetaceae bacterium]|nr:DUF3987 domain-containing protein [Planctomycetaceae bacterium]
MEDFLAGMFGTSISTERRLALFTVPERRARFFGDLESAGKVASKLAESQNVYFGVGLIQGTPAGRGKQEDIAGIVALWADVDFVGDAHTGKSLPTDESDFERLLAELPLRPSMIVDSGHGRHLYWLLHEPWLFTDDSERTQAAHLAKAWHELVCTAAQRLGWSLENLGDLTRVLRLPNTVNRKHPAAPVAVQLMQADFDRRFSIDDFENYLPTEKPSSPPRVAAPVDPCELPIALASDAEPPADKLVAAILESSVFRETWDRKRSDLSDSSASGYDLSLATIAMMRGWTDNEVARLILAWRRRHGMQPEKALRADYMARTLARARKATVTDESTDVDLSAFPMVAAPSTSQIRPAVVNPGPMPDSLCRVPGFVSAVMDHCLELAPYPNVQMAFCGAMALQAVLAGRKVRDEADNRTNIYLLALAFSSSGKDFPRKVNAAILHRVGLVQLLGEKIASGEGIQDALNLTPSILFQTDEIDGLLQSINKSRDARHENIMGTLLTMYSSANSIFPMRRKAGKEAPGVIDQPCLVVYGTAIPTHYYNALSERMLTNGFFARMLIVESGPRTPGRTPGIIDPPEAIIEQARWWSEFNPGTGNLEYWHPQPRIVPATAEARDLLNNSRLLAESEYSAAESRGDPVGTTVWGRVHEQTRKLALLYAISENHLNPVIGSHAVEWADAFVLHQTRRMLFMAEGHVAENPFHSDCLRLIKKLSETPGQTLPHSTLLKRMKLDAKSFQILVDTLVQQGDLETVSIRTNGRSGLLYRLSGERSGECETSRPDG